MAAKKYKSNLPTIQELNRLLAYEPETGALSWRISSGCMKRGKPAGSITHKGYINIKIKRDMHQAHRIAWAIHYGEHPSTDLDHINGDGTDNRICNLRPCSHSQNCQNSTIPANNKSGAKGVHWHARSGKWRVQIGANGTYHYGGMFDDLSVAASVAMALRMKLHGDFARAA